MASQYPAQIDDSITLPVVADNSTLVRATVLNELRAAIIAVESALGVNPASVYGNVRDRITAIETSLNTVANNAVVIGGDIAGTNISPIVAGLRGITILDIEPESGEVLAYNGLGWVPTAPDVAAGAFQAAGDLDGSNISQTVIAIQGIPVSETAPLNGNVLVSDGITWAPGTVNSFTAAGDLSGSSSTQTVIGIQGNPVSAAVPNVNDSFIWSGTEWAPGTAAVQLPAIYEISLLSGMTTTTSSTFTRVGAREIDMTLFPSTIGALTRTVEFVADVDKTSGATNVEVQLYDTTNVNVVLGTDLTSTSNDNIAVTAIIAVGGVPNLQAGASQYELQIKMNGGGGSDAVFITNARIVITYA